MTTAKQKVEELDAALSRVRFELAPHEMALEFLLDGVQINEAALAQPLPLDPGKHELRVGSSGWETGTVNFIVSTEERESSVVVPIPLKRLGPASTIDSPPSPSVVSKPAWPLPLALVTGGLGLGSLAVAAGFGVDAFNQANTVQQHCPNLLCDPTGEEALADGRQSAVVSNATAIVGGALSGLSIVFFVIAATAGGEPDPAPIPVQVNFDANAIQISARWLL
jgi:hypothetical protein